MKKILKSILFLSCLMIGTSCERSTTQTIIYQATFDSNDSCKVYRINATMDVEAEYGEGWTFKQYGNSLFEFSNDEKKFVYSNNRYGYKIIIDETSFSSN